MSGWSFTSILLLLYCSLQTFIIPFLLPIFKNPITLLFGHCAPAKSMGCHLAWQHKLYVRIPCPAILVKDYLDYANQPCEVRQGIVHLTHNTIHL